MKWKKIWAAISNMCLIMFKRFFGSNLINQEGIDKASDFHEKVAPNSHIHKNHKMIKRKTNRFLVGFPYLKNKIICF